MRTLTLTALAALIAVVLTTVSFENSRSDAARQARYEALNLKIDGYHKAEMSALARIGAR